MKNIDEFMNSQDVDSHQPLIQLHQLSVTYEDTAHSVLSNIDFELREGESVLFLGPSGCGKSTLAMVCAGLIPGSIEAEVTGEVNLDATIAGPGGVGYVFQDPDSQFCMIQVDDEIAFGLENLQVSPHQMGARIEEALHRVGLKTPKVSQHANFSGGMKQKLAIASALAMKSKLLIFDEPTANLDPYASRKVFEEIESLAEAGETLVVIEHKFDRLLGVMDRVVLFERDGTIYRTGPTEQVIQEEWQWMIDTGVVAPWKSPPLISSKQGASVLTLSHQNTELALNTEPALNTMDVPMPSPAASAVEIASGTVRYGDQTVWEDLSVRVPAGSFTAIVGPNGAGKSTLLQSIAGLQNLSAGSLSVLGKSLKEWRKSGLAKSVSFCFQNPEFQFIFERVADELSNQVVTGPLPASTSELLQQFGLAGYEEHSPFGLSQGQKRRLSVASMLREQHELYLLDEPTFGQDAHTQQVIMERMKELHQSGKTIIMTTHDMDLVNRYASHVLVLSGGEQQFFGSPSELWSHTDLVQSAHLLADVRTDAEPQGGSEQGHKTHTDQDFYAGSVHRDALEPLTQHKWKLNPVWKLGAVLLFALVAMFSNTLYQSLSLFGLSILVMLWFGRMNPWKIVKRFSPFLIFYIFYLFTFVAYSRVPAGDSSVHFLWMNFSMHGLYNGGVLAFRMLSAVGAAIFLLSTTSMTDMVVSLCQDARVAPKFSYGVLAGLRLVPLFQNEWVKLRQARQLRGRDAGRAWMRPVTYAIPLLSQAIRMSERVAVAMEARGLVAEAARSPQQRTYYRHVQRSWRDPFFTVFLNLLSVIFLLTIK
ncbi:ATP-binding cassette domain-containing protein [Alicyclobacillus sp. SO9]|uniref:ATP-binding cassette domain-containing protein n=1 Tax=Alicyclobacillus sp. SO9 TaxID=2665646 RepID=UPI0018E8CA98|nr:ATP-binding cassette domain-containing protein [Alicyclobacillus sp. SO9]QQE80212.1 ATP-binding cassette domain-containing protein [Alicyclobacillus sp. SO9]